MDIQFLLQRLETKIAHARKLPMTNQVILEQQEILDLIDQIRAAVPEEVRQARRLTQEGERVISRAREEAEQIISAAQEQADLLLQEHELIRAAEGRARDIEERARSNADETVRGADQYAADVLARLETDLAKALAIVKRSLEVLEDRRAEAARSGERG